MGLFSDKLTKTEKERLLLFRRLSKHKSEISSYVPGLIEEQSTKFVEKLIDVYFNDNYLYCDRSGGELIGYCLEKNINPDHFKAVLTVIAKENDGKIYFPDYEIRDLSNTDAALITVLFEHPFFRMEDSDTFLSKAVIANNIPVLDALLDGFEKQERYVELRRVNWVDIFKLAKPNIWRLFELSDESVEDTAEYFLKLGLKTRNDEFIDATLGFLARRNMALTEFDLTDICIRAQDMGSVADFLGKCGLEPLRREKELKNAALVLKDIAYLGDHKIAFEKDEAFTARLWTKAFVDGDTDFVIALLARGIPLNGISPTASAPVEFLLRLDPEEYLGLATGILDALSKHPEAGDVYKNLAKKFIFENEKEDILKHLCKKAGFSDDVLIELLGITLKRDEKDLSRLLISHITSFEDAPEDFIVKIGAVGHIPLIEEMTDKGLRFGEHIDKAIRHARCYSDATVKHLKAVKQQERSNAYPQWRYVNKHTVAEMSLAKAQGEKDFILLSRAFNFRAHTVDVSYEIYKDEKFEDVKPGASLSFAEINPSLIEEAEKALKRHGGIVEEKIQDKKAIPLPRRAVQRIGK